MNIRKLVSNYLKSVNKLNDVSDSLNKMQEAQKSIVNTNNNLVSTVKDLTQHNEAIEKGIIEPISFTIVTACYNNQKYIDDYFISMIKQDYFSNLQIIIVDDGSSDDSKKEIEKWASMYPENIEYYYQENKGQSEARNLGLKHVKNPWVTFIDMDDFISENYFYELSLAITKYGKKIGMYVNKWVSYYEKNGQKKDDHPLNYRFKKIARFKEVNLETNPDYFYLSVSSTVFNSDVIKMTGLKFKEIKPNFEDANFIDAYLRIGNFSKCLFLRDTEYFYRKRADQSSTIDKSKKDITRYLDLLETGYLATFEEFGNKIIPKHVQKQIYYDLRWNFEGFMQIRDKFTEANILRRNQLLTDIFTYIDLSTVRSSGEIVNRQFERIVLSNFYNEKLIPEVTYIQQERNSLTLKFEGIESEINKVKINGKRTDDYPHAVKTHLESIDVKYVETFVKIPKSHDTFPVIEWETKVLDILKINENYSEKSFTPKAKILFYDRLDKADDNAEVMYDWIKENHPEYENCYFAISRDCADYERLIQKGFKVLAYGEEEFEEFYADADFILTSAGDDSIHNYKRYRYFWYKSNAKFIFLQHGITTDDMSPWMFGKRINKMVLATYFEKEEFEQNKYSLFDDELYLTGFPRFDKLYNDPKEQILLSYTWRKEYEGLSIKEFRETDFARQMQTIMTSASFLTLLEKNNLNLKVILHPNFNKYRDIFSKYTGNNVQLIDIATNSYRTLFAESNLLITDFSSVFADFAYLGKPVLFHQFEKERFYENHTYKPALDYEKQGLGPVVYETDSLLKEIEKTIASNFEPSSVYKERRNSYFAYKDSNNCLRLFESLVRDYPKVGNP